MFSNFTFEFFLDVPSLSPFSLEGGMYEFFFLYWLEQFFHEKICRGPSSLPTGPMYFVFCRLYASSQNQHGSVWLLPEPVFVDLLGSPGVDSQPDGPVRQPQNEVDSSLKN
jgi:hypothetical protein